MTTLRFEHFLATLIQLCYTKRSLQAASRLFSCTQNRGQVSRAGLLRQETGDFTREQRREIMEQTTERRRKRKKKKAESILFYIIPFVIINYIIFRLATAQPDFDLTIGDCVDDRSVTFSVKMTGPLPVSDFRALLDDEPVEMTEAGSGTYTATVTKNGTLEVSAGYFNGMVKTQYERISTIDDEPPTVAGHEMNGTFLTVSFADSQSGVDLATVYALDSDGTTLLPLELSEENLSARFQTLSDSLDVHIKDKNGNEGSFVIENLTSMGSSGEDRTASGEGGSSGSSGSSSSGSSSSGSSSSGSSSSGSASSSGSSSSGSRSSSGSSGSSGSSARETTKAAETTKARETTKAAETTKAKETTKAAETTKAKETTKAAETTKAKETTSASETTKASATETAAADPENTPGSSGTSSVSPAPSGTSAGSSSGSSPVSAAPVSTTEAAAAPTASAAPGGGSSSGPASTTAAGPSPQTGTTDGSSGGPGVQTTSAAPSPQPETAAASPAQETSAQSAGPSPDGNSGGSVATVEAVPGF